MTARDVIVSSMSESGHKYLRPNAVADAILAALADDSWRVVKLEQPGTETTRLMLCNNEYTVWDSDSEMGEPLYIVTEEVTP